MKKILIWLAITAAFMIGLPFLFITFTGESAMAFCFLCFYALNPIYCVVAGVAAGLNFRRSWIICLMPPALFLTGVYLFFDIYERIFYHFTLAYLIIAVLIMLFVRRESNR
ncbi:MAG: hypothetical protein IJM79_05490 [Erysipelotrichaceae bacterium]|nr:hypothetical protein [Erysipelotrichaceae bacterium]